MTFVRGSATGQEPNPEDQTWEEDHKEPCASKPAVQPATQAEPFWQPGVDDLPF